MIQKRYRLLTNVYNDCDEILFLQDVDETKTYYVAIKDEIWVKVMKSELDIVERNHTWKLIELPPCRKPIELKRVYKLKVDPYRNVIKQKTKLVAKG